MITSLHFARALERQIEILRRSGKKGEKAVDQFQAICHSVVSDAMPHYSLM
jgi:hypothetical protein